MRKATMKLTDEEFSDILHSIVGKMTAATILSHGDVSRLTAIRRGCGYRRLLAKWRAQPTTKRLENE